MTAVTIRPMTAADAKAVLAIYQAGMDGGNASFEHTAPSWQAFDASKLAAHRLVAIDEQDTVLGWVAVSAVSSRAVYAGVVEHSVYVDPAALGRGIGRALLEALFASTEAAGIWTIQSRDLPGEHRQPRPAHLLRVPHPRRPRTDRPAHRAEQPVARRRVHRTPQLSHQLIKRNHAARPRPARSSTLGGCS